ncbi:MAG: twin-arginine translocase subunit TatC [Chitinophagales bacterium]|jgi:sec-independent protein translocase protein TatC|nr:twin-arginine translocase subunit TatC [Chitinophagales bacterium]
MAIENKSGLNFFDHLEILRKHVIRSILVVSLLCILIFLNSRIIFNDILFAPLDPNFFTYKLLCYLDQAMCMTQIKVNLINTELAGQFYIHLQTSFVLALVVGTPYFLFELWLFIKPALTANELQYSRLLLGFGFILFLLGASFGYFFVFPLTVLFLMQYQISDKIVDLPNLANYFDNLSSAVLWSGLSFELPVLAYLLTKFGVIHQQMLISYRKHLYIALLLVAAAITPGGDIISQVMVTIPLILLFEVSILVVGRVEQLEKTAPY